tara:strand:- start:1122 stop:2357 length:1236 start_codon:yes stop_codon:yes gene_type:complete
MKRRDFVKLGATTFACGNVTASYADDSKREDTAVLFLFLGGGASHIETFNPIPFAPADRRSVTGATKTNVTGIELGGLFKELSKRTDKIAIPRAFGHRDQNHASAVHWVVTGEANFGSSAGTSSKWPSYGSMASKHHGVNTDDGLPTYVKLGQYDHNGAAWLGGKYTGFDATKEGRKDLQLMRKSEDFRTRINVLNVIDNSFKAREQQLAKDWRDLRNQSVDIILGNGSKAFRVEEDKDYNKFKEATLGQDALTAIRLLQAGSKFVSLNYGGWDMHQNIGESLNTKQVELDHYLGKIMDTLEARGLYERVMLVVTSEFGRTPKVNKDQGRDHFGKIAPLMISCGSYEMGRTIGQTNTNADDIEDGRCTPEDLAWTIYDHLNMNRTTRYTATDGRPHSIVKDDSKNILKDIT